MKRKREDVLKGIEEEKRRIEFLLNRDGEVAAKKFSENTYRAYRQALYGDKDNYAKTSGTRERFLGSLLFLRKYLNK